MALSISCKNNDKTGSGGVDLGSMPTASGNNATIGGTIFEGSLSLTDIKLQGITEEEAAMPETIQVSPNSYDWFRISNIG